MIFHVQVVFQCKIEIELTVRKKSSLDFLSFYPVRTTASGEFVLVTIVNI